MCESSFQDNPGKGQKSKRVGYLKMKVISDLKADDSTSYGDLKHHVGSHTSKVIKPEELKTVLPWVYAMQ